MEQIHPRFETTEEEAKRILSQLEGKRWEELSEDQKRKLIEIAALYDLSEKTAEQLKNIMPNINEMDPEDRAFYLRTLEELGLATKEEIEQ